MDESSRDEGIMDVLFPRYNNGRERELNNQRTHGPLYSFISNNLNNKIYIAFATHLDKYYM